MASSLPPPALRPDSPYFSSGPCAKRPGYSLDALSHALLGRSHRAAAPKKRLAEVIDRSARLLGLPEGWRVAIVPGSDTGAIEMAMWSMLGARGVDVIAFESFSGQWAMDVVKQLKLRRLAAAWLTERAVHGVDLRFDVVSVLGVRVRVIEAAF